MSNRNRNMLNGLAGHNFAVSQSITSPPSNTQYQNTTNSSVGANIGSMPNSSTWQYQYELSLDPVDRFYVYDDVLDFEDVMLVPTLNHQKHISSRKDIDLTMDSERIPIVAANMDHVGTFPVAKELSKHGLMTAITKDTSVDDWQSSIKKYAIEPRYLIPTIGLQNFDDELKKVDKLLSLYDTIDHVCFDVANGYLYDFRKALEKLRNVIPKEIDIIAGNVVTSIGCKALYEHGASIIKIGIGGGSVCETRTVAGVGYPQFSSLLECQRAKCAYPNMKLMSDGGCTNSGDIAKAFGIVDYVMIGGMLAGHHETGSLFYGNSSEIALDKMGTNNDHRASEGRVVNLEENRGHLTDSIKQWLGGLRSACTYCNSSSLRELREDSQYVKVRRQLNDSLIR